MEIQNLIGDPQTRLAEVIASTPSCLKIVDRDGRLLTMNPTGLTMIEAPSLEAVLGLSVYSLVEPSHQARFKAFNERICAGEEGELTFEIIGLNGARRWMETFAGPYQLTNGEIAHIAITNDVSERHIAEETMEAQRHALEVTSRLSSLGELASGIAHEINNPLGVIAGYAGMLRHEAQTNQLDNTTLVNNLNAIEETVNRISRIVSSLRTLSSDIPDDQHELCCIKTLIAQAQSLSYEKSRSNGISLTLTSQGETTAMVNRVQISQVFLNLLTNSFHALKCVDDKWVRVHIRETGDRLSIFFTDSGNGIASNVADKIMTPFFTTKSPGEGTGLGLSISARIIRNHGGELRYDPEPANTTFVVDLPRMTTPIT